MTQCSLSYWSFEVQSHTNWLLFESYNELTEEKHTREQQELRLARLLADAEQLANQSSCCLSVGWPFSFFWPFKNYWLNSFYQNTEEFLLVSLILKSQLRCAISQIFNSARLNTVTVKLRFIS